VAFRRYTGNFYILPILLKVNLAVVLPISLRRSLNSGYDLRHLTIEEFVRREYPIEACRTYHQGEFLVYNRCIRFGWVGYDSQENTFTGYHSDRDPQVC